MNRGCDLGEKTRDILPNLRNAEPEWRPEWDELVEEIRISDCFEVSHLEIDTDPSIIIHAPLAQVIPLAQEHSRPSFSEPKKCKPFDGLVKQRPGRAVAVLTHAARQGDYPVEFWLSAMEAWPQEVRQRLIWLFGARLARLPSEIVVKLGVHVFKWLRNHFPKLAVQDQPRALSILDALLDKLYKGGADATINAPVGTATELLLDLLNSLSPGERADVPPEIKSRLERLFHATDESADYAVCIVANRLRWLDYVDPDWVHSTVLPWFDPDQPASESAWAGFLYDAHPDTHPLKPELFSLIKPHFLKVFTYALNPNWDDFQSQQLHNFLVLGCFWHQSYSGWITFQEAREVLQQTDDRGRAYSAQFLSRFVNEKHSWRGFGKSFLERSWPRETRFQTEETSKHFVELAGRAGNLFPEMVRTILPYLVPNFQDNWFLHEIFHIRNKPELPKLFPDATLELLDKLVPDNPSKPPYDLDTTLEMITEAEPSLRQDGRWRRLKDIAL